MLKHRTIFFFWIPLALSWFLMTFEHPWVQGVISRLPNAKTELAAFGLIISLMVMIESPIIMMLGTSAALSKNRQAYPLLWRYMMMVNAYVTLIAFLMGFTPLLDWWLGRLVGVQQNIIDAVRPGIQIMLFWPAFVGYRRFHQGLLIRNNHTKPIGYGTVIRLGGSAVAGIALGMGTNMSGAAVGAAAMVFSAFAEMIYVIIVSRKDVKAVMQTEPKPSEKPLTYLSAFRFHLPLALTMLFTLLVRPVIERGLATAPNAESSLAAWAVIFSIVLIARSGSMAYQEVVIALSDSDQATRKLRDYAWMLGGILSVVLTLLAYTPLMSLYIDRVLGVPDDIQGLVLIGVRVGVMIPLLATFQSYYRALLMRTDTTSPIYIAMMISFAVTSVTMIVGVRMGFEGVAVAVLGLVLGFVTEVGVLWWSLTSNEEKLTLVYAQATGD